MSLGLGWLGVGLCSTILPGVLRKDQEVQEVTVLAPSAERNRQRLGRELRFAREAAGYTQQQVASLLDCEQGKVSKIERAFGSINENDLDQMLLVYEVAAEKKIELRQLHANSAIPRAVPGYPARSAEFARMMTAETEAEEILSWHSERVPGPCQHLRYMFKQFELDRRGQRDRVSAAQSALDMRRQIFTADPPPRYHVVLSQSSFYRLPGGWSCDLELDQIDQFRTLLDQYPQFDLRILPYTAKLAYVDTDFTVLKFRQDTQVTAPQEDFVFLEHAGGAEIVKDTAKFFEHWVLLAQEALSREETVAYLDERRDDLIRGRGLRW